MHRDRDLSLSAGRTDIHGAHSLRLPPGASLSGNLINPRSRGGAWTCEQTIRVRQPASEAGPRGATGTEPHSGSSSLSHWGLLVCGDSESESDSEEPAVGRE
jgi:hypothetical protein